MNRDRFTLSLSLSFSLHSSGIFVLNQFHQSKLGSIENNRERDQEQSIILLFVLLCVYVAYILYATYTYFMYKYIWRYPSIQSVT